MCTHLDLSLGCGKSRPEDKKVSIFGEKMEQRIYSAPFLSPESLLPGFAASTFTVEYNTVTICEHTVRCIQGFFGWESTEVRTHADLLHKEWAFHEEHHDETRIFTRKGISQHSNFSHWLLVIFALLVLPHTLLCQPMCMYHDHASYPQRNFPRKWRITNMRTDN